MLSAILALQLAAPTTAEKIVAHAREQTTWGTRYDPAYVRLKYPGGDVPRDRGVCTDVVIRALRSVGYDLQKLVYEDKKRAPRAYPSRKRDPNIDHRRCRELIPFFRRHGQELPIRPVNPSDWKPGDLVFWKLPGGLDHVGILSDRRNPEGWPLVIHNIRTTAEEDVLWEWKVVARFRYPVPRAEKPARRVESPKRKN